MTIVDSGPYDRRAVTSFIGGLDLTAGRWDTPSHKLFFSLDREHKGDFRNKSWPVSFSILLFHGHIKIFCCGARV
jgi:phospholipase D1/2